MSVNRRILLFSGPAHSATIVTKLMSDQFEVRSVEPVADSLLPVFRHCTVFLDASMKVPISVGDIVEAASLQLVVTATTGATHIDARALAQRGVPLLTLKGEKQVLQALTPAAELSWSLVMACARRLRPAIAHVDAGRWDRIEFPGLMLKGRVIGIIGMGRIGGWMARYAAAFGMEVVYFDPFVKQVPENTRAVSLEELVSIADVVSLHVHATDENKNLLNRELIAKFKSGAIFINTSRGELTDEQALVEALQSGRLGAVGVDVLSGEPDIIHNPLWHYAQENDQVVITPHIGGFCPDAVDHVVTFSCNRILEYFHASAKGVGE